MPLPSDAGGSSAAATTAVAQSRRELRFSIVTVCWNAADTIEDTLQSVAEQKYPHVEHIVVDGGSTDGTREIIARYPHIAKVISEPDDGLYDAMNKGWQAATGDYVSWLNADDMLATSDVLDRLSDAATSRLAILAASVAMVDAKDTMKVWRRYGTRGFHPRQFRNGFSTPHPGFHIRRDMLERLGGYNLRYALAADFDLMARAFQLAGDSYIMLDDVTVRMRVGGRSNGLKSMLKMLNESYESCLANGIRTSRPRVALRLVRKLLQFIPSTVRAP